MLLSPAGKNLIKGFEGLSLTAYPDAAGYSIGYGHFGANPGDVITREEADRLFDRDVAKFELAVSTIVPRATQAQFDAMTSLAYNIGTAGFADSTVARLHNIGDYAGAADAFRMWNKSQGKVHQGLVARREKERAFYLSDSAPSPTHFPTEPPAISSWPLATGSEQPESPASSQPPAASGWSSVVPTHAKTGALGAVVVGLGWLIWSLIRR